MIRTIEQKEQDIKKNWFPEHVAQVKEMDGITILDWRKPGTNMYSVRYIFAGSSLFIAGDIGDAVFGLTWHGTIESFKDIDLGYLMGKLTCSSRERFEFNQEKADLELKEWRDERIEYANDECVKEINEVCEGVQSAIFESSSVDYFNHMVFSVYNQLSLEYVDGEEFSMISDFGKESPSVFSAYLLGIKMAHKQLKSKTSIM